MKGSLEWEGALSQDPGVNEELLFILLQPRWLPSAFTLYYNHLFTHLSPLLSQRVLLIPGCTLDSLFKK